VGNLCAGFLLSGMLGFCLPISNFQSDMGNRAPDRSVTMAYQAPAPDSTRDVADPGSESTNRAQDEVPEPATMFATGAGLIFVALGLRKIHKR